MSVKLPEARVYTLKLTGAVGSPWMRGPLRIATAVLACWGVSAFAAPSASAVNVYSFANGCYALRDMTSNRFVVRDVARLRSQGRDRPGRDAVPHAGDWARALPPLRP